MYAMVDSTPFSVEEYLDYNTKVSYLKKREGMREWKRFIKNERTELGKVEKVVW